MTAVPEILSAVPTPFGPTGEVDLSALRTNLERLLPLVDGVFAAGTTGEFPALTDDERLAVIGEALEVFGPARVIAHVGAPSAHQAVRLLESASKLGAQRFAAITPYFLRASTAGITSYYKALKDAAGRGSVYAYVFPEVAGTDLQPAELPAVISNAGIDGIKVSGAASARVHEYLASAPEEFSLWSGNDADLPNILAAGGKGTVSGVSAVSPEPWAAYREAVRSNDAAAATSAQEDIETLVPLLGPSIAALKFGISYQGLPGGDVRMEIDPVSPARQQEIRSAIDRVNSAASH
jgi:dihydrodipicolinate synthase/N-acetylneuraminate lyase